MDKIADKKSFLRTAAGRPAAFAFFGAFAAGFFTHLFVFTNLIPNSDGIGKIYDTQQMTVSGRWFLHYASLLNKFVEAPALIGFLSLIFISLAAYLTVDLLGIENRFASAAVGILAAIFPPAAYTFLYTFTAAAYFFGLFLAAAGVWLTAKYKFGFIPGAALIALSLGIYQVYFGAALALGVLYLASRLFDRSAKVKEALTKALHLLLSFILGAGVYYAVLKIMLAVKDLELLSYRGMNEFSVLKLPSRIGFAFTDFFRYFFGVSDPCLYSTKLLVFLNILLLAAGMIFVISKAIRSGLTKDLPKLIFLVVLAAIFPVAANFSAVLASGTEVTPIMRYPLVFALIIPAAAYCGCEKLFKKTLAFVLSSALAVGVAGSSLFYAQVDNVAYTSVATAHRATESFCTRLVLRVESLEGYSPDMPVYIIGSYPRALYGNDTEIFSLTAHYSAPADTVIELNKHFYYYLNDWLNVNWQKPSEEEMYAVADSEEFKAMPLYPADGSVKISSGRVIVKLSEEYRGLSDYEIQYENRR